MLFKNIVSIGYKQGISVDPHMWPIPQVMLRELLVASPIYISLRLLWLLRVIEGGGKREGGGKEILWIEWKLILALFYSNSSTLWFINYPLIFHLMFNLKFPFLKILCKLEGGGGGIPWLSCFLISKSPAHQWIWRRIQTRAVHGGLLVHVNICLTATGLCAFPQSIPALIYLALSLIWLTPMCGCHQSCCLILELLYYWY